MEQYKICEMMPKTSSCLSIRPSIHQSIKLHNGH